MVFKRVIAYFIDILIVVFAASMLSSISYINPQLKKYSKVYDEYIEVYEEFKNNDNKLEEKEIKEFNNKLKDINYTLDKNNIYGAVISIVITICYFAVFQKYNGGQTLGKKLMRLKIEDNLSLPKYLLRTVILHNTWVNALRVILLLTISKKAYISTNEILTIVSLAIEVTIILMVSMRQDNRGLHDLLIGSRVTFVPKVIKGDE